MAMSSGEFIARLKKAAKQPTYYVMGCFGAIINDKNIQRYVTSNAYNRNHAAKIRSEAIGKFGFDCVCLIKGILWGWNSDRNAAYGGAIYKSNGVPDIGADQMIQKCKDVSTDFSNIIPGEAVWLPGHIGVYIGDGLVIECTPKWENKVQITALGNAGAKAGYNARTWQKHGKLPYVQYAEATAPATTGEKAIWDYLVSLIGNEYGAAGLMGNLYAESGLRSNNLQNTYEKSLGMSNEQYTQAVDSGAYTNFVKDAAGYGLAQWTYWSRKQNLLNHAKAAGASIGDLNMQLNFLGLELKGYPGVMRALQSASSVREASDAVLTGYERPKDQSEAVKAKRASFGQIYFDKYAGGTVPVAPITPATPAKVKASESAQLMDKDMAGTYTATANLHLRDGAGTDKKSLVVMTKGTRVQNYGYYTRVGSTRWLYIQFTLNGVQYTGFSPGDYLRR